MLDPQIPPVLVRLATEADLPAVVEIYMRAYAQPPWNERHEPISSEGYLRWVLNTPGTRCLVSQAGTESPVQGFVLVGPRGYEQFVEDWERLADQPVAGWPAVPGRLGYIWEIAVHPDAQRRGHGAGLLRAAIESVRQEGIDTMVLRSSERATAAVGLYRRFGFQRLPVSERVDPLSGPWALPLGAAPGAGAGPGVA